MSDSSVWSRCPGINVGEIGADDGREALPAATTCARMTMEFAEVGGGGKFAEIDEQNLDVEDDPIQQRSRDAVAVVFDLPGWQRH